MPLQESMMQLKLIIIITVYMWYVIASVCMPRHTDGGQRMTFGSWFSLDCGIELRTSSLWDKCFHP